MYSYPFSNSETHRLTTLPFKVTFILVKHFTYTFLKNVLDPVDVKIKSKKLWVEILIKPVYIHSIKVL